MSARRQARRRRRRVVGSGGGDRGGAGGDLAGLLLVLHLAEGDGEPAEQSAERAHEPTDGRGDDADELAVENLAGGQPRERADLVDVEWSAVHESTLERQQLGGAGVVGDGLGGGGDVAAHEREGGGPGEELLERLCADLVGGTLGERVLDDLEGGVGLAQRGAQLSDLGDGDTAVVDGEDRVGLVYVAGDLVDRDCLLVSVHGAPVPVLCWDRWKIGLLGLPGVCGGRLWEWRLGGDGSRGRLLDDFTCL